MKESTERSIEITSLVQMQIALLGSLLIFVGIVGSEAYYSVFGIQYQSIGLSVPHLMYRGITAAFNEWYLFLIYILAAMTIGAPSFIKVNNRRELLLKNAIILFTSFSLIFIAYLGTNRSARNSAYKDLTLGSTTLPKIVSISPNKLLGEYVGKRLLAFGGEYFVITEVVQDPKKQRPYTLFLRKEKVDELFTDR